MRTDTAGHNLMLDAPQTVIAEVIGHLDTAASVRKQWIADLGTHAGGEDQACSKLPPHCLRIQLSPKGKTFRIRNKCDETYRGVVRVTCSGWAPDAAVEYRFNLGAKSELAQEGIGANAGRSNGTCYFRPRLCAKVTAPVRPSAASFSPFL